MKFLLSPLLLALPFAILMAQPNFQKKYTTGDPASINFAAAPDGGFVLVFIDVDIFKPVVIKVDQAGNVVWATFPEIFDTEVIRDVLVDQQGNISILYQTRDVANQREYVVLLKMDAAGQKLWERIIFDVSDLDTFNFTNFSSTSDGGYLVSYPVTDFQTGFWCAKVDQAGNVLWARDYSMPEGGVIQHAMEDKDGNYLMFGLDYFVLGGDPDFSALLKIAPDGTILFSRSYENFTGLNMAVFSNGDYLLHGYDNSQNEFKWVLMRTNTAGEIIWSKSVTAPNSLYSPSITNNDHILSTATYTLSENASVVMKMDGNGNFIWQKAYPGYNGGATAIPSTNKNIGVLSQILDQNLDGELVLLKTDENGLLPGCQPVDICFAMEDYFTKTGTVSWTVTDLESTELPLLTMLTPIPISAIDIVCTTIDIPKPEFSVNGPICPNGCIGVENLSQQNAHAWEWYFEKGTPTNCTGARPRRNLLC